MPTVRTLPAGRGQPPRVAATVLLGGRAVPSPPSTHHFPDCPGARCDCRARGLRLLVALDLPDCACPQVWTWDDVKQAHALEPCPHVLAAWPHTLSAVEWAALLALLDPDHHAEPAALPLPALVLTRAARVAIYSERQACGEQLWCDRDLWRAQATDDRIQAGPAAEHEPNGAPVVSQRLSARRPT